MEAKYDPEVDVLRDRWSSKAVAESDEEQPGLILDYDHDGRIVGIEVLRASERIENIDQISWRSRLDP